MFLCDCFRNELVHYSLAPTYAIGKSNLGLMGGDPQKFQDLTGAGRGVDEGESNFAPILKKNISAIFQSAI
jgi:hypothetical protein